jgi:hypothetical protein
MRGIAIAVIAVLALLFVIGCQPVNCPEKTCPACEVCPEEKECPVCEECKGCPDCEVCLDDKPMLDVDMLIWAINEYDNSEMLFDYWIYNYGDTEAKDVKVKCKLEDTRGKVLKTVVDNYGNLASRSGELGEVVTSKPSISMTQEYIGYCFVDSCKNCEILYKRIPDLIEAYQS